MSVQIIKRSNGQPTQKETVRGNDYLGTTTQVSFNSDGHLVVRVITSRESDSLFVFDELSSKKIIEFCQDKLPNPKIGDFIKQTIKQSIGTGPIDLPF